MSDEAFYSQIPLDQGSYTASQASRLLNIPVRNIRRWMLGYKRGDHYSTPLWQPQIPIIDNELEFGFRDLIELRFVQSFMNAGLGLLAIRNCLQHAKEFVDNSHPFSTQSFKTDGRTIFLESSNSIEESELIDLKNKQYVIKSVIEKSFKDLDIEEGIVARWRPYKGKSSIIIDPKRSFGQPIINDFGVATRVLSDAVKAEESIKKVSFLYEVPEKLVKDALNFEKSLDHAA